MRNYKEFLLLLYLFVFLLAPFSGGLVKSSATAVSCTKSISEHFAETRCQIFFKLKKKGKEKSRYSSSMRGAMTGIGKQRTPLDEIPCLLWSIGLLMGGRSIMASLGCP